MSDATGTTGPAAALAVQWEEHRWKSELASTPAASRAQRAVLGRPYSSAVPVDLADVTLDLDPAVAAAAEDARAEVTRFDAELSAVFSGELAPLSSVLLRTESSSSSQIEHITAGAKALSLAEVGLGTLGSNASLVAANVEAMNRALQDSSTLTPLALLAIHEALMRGQRHADPGAYREQQVWVGGTSFSPHGAIFVPPHHARVPAAVVDLCAFAARTDLPLLPQVAVAHAQLETIHPFVDGNGRTGRALVHTMLKHAGTTTRMTIPISAGLLADPQRYFDALTAYRRGDPHPIVSRFTDAAFTAITNGRHLAGELTAIHGRWHDALRARKDGVAWRILPLLLSQPTITSSIVQSTTGVSQPTADNALRQLHDSGIITRPRTVEGAHRRRNVVWHATEVLDALDAFGDRARRRHG